MFMFTSRAALRMAVYQAIQETASVFHVPTDVERQSECQSWSLCLFGGGSKDLLCLCVCCLPMTDESLS